MEKNLVFSLNAIFITVTYTVTLYGLPHPVPTYKADDMRKSDSLGLFSVLIGNFFNCLEIPASFPTDSPVNM